MLKSGGFELHKWCANSPALLADVTPSQQEQQVDFADTQSVKTLGLRWHPNQDTLVIIIQEPAKIIQAPTKRFVLSEIARLFDPLGLVGPIIVTAKILLQTLWQKGLEWDQPLDKDDQQTWQQFRDQLTQLQQIAVPRRVIPASNYVKSICWASATPRMWATVPAHTFTLSTTISDPRCCFVQSHALRR
jgi:Pao retrotransposon peptidase